MTIEMEKNVPTYTNNQFQIKMTIFYSLLQILKMVVSREIFVNMKCVNMKLKYWYEKKIKRTI